MKTAIIYYSLTGHSKKIACAIGNALKIQVYNVKDNPILNDVDLLFIVGGIYGSKSHNNLINYVDALNRENVKKVALITSCCGGVNPQKDIRELLNKNDIKVIEDEYICRGNFLFFGIGHPNKHEIKDAIEFARQYL